MEGSSSRAICPSGWKTILPCASEMASMRSEVRNDAPFSPGVEPTSGMIPFFSVEVGV